MREVTGSSPVVSTKKFDKSELIEFFYPSRRLGISSRVSVYIIAEGVYHQPKAVYFCDLMICNGKAIDDIPQQVADDIQGCRLDFYRIICYNIFKGALICLKTIY